VADLIDWQAHDEDLPDVLPGAEFEGRVAPQKFIVLRRIAVRDLVLVRLQIGTATVPCELEHTDGTQRTYRPKDLADAALQQRLVATGAAATRDAIAISPGLEVRMVLRNEGSVPTKPRAALIVHEEEDPH
jgi:hypothetical protein